MKVVCIADTHNMHNHLDLPDGDVLIHCGDITMCGTLSELLDFVDWLDTQDYNHKIVIAGNHDKCLGESEFLGMKMFTNAIYLQNSSVTIEGIKFWGSPATPAFHGMRAGLTFYTNSDREAKGIWRGIPHNTDFLITHGPPLGILDTVKGTFEEGFLPRYCGDGMLASKVIKIKPKYHAFGHIHERGGKTFKADYGTTFINCSVVNEAYNLVNKPMVIDI